MLEHPNLNLSQDERHLFGQVFAAADTDNIGVVTGDVALKFFPEKTRLPSEVLGEVSGEINMYGITAPMLIDDARNRYGKLQTRKTKGSLRLRVSVLFSD